MELEHADSDSLHAAWATASRLGAGQGGLFSVPPASSKIIDELIYRRLSPEERASVDRLHRQQEYAQSRFKPTANHSLHSTPLHGV